MGQNAFVVKSWPFRFIWFRSKDDRWFWRERRKWRNMEKGANWASETDRGNEWTTEATCINAPWAQNQHFTTFWEKETFLWSEDKRIKRETERKTERKKERFVQGRARCWNKSGILFIIFSLRFISGSQKDYLQLIQQKTVEKEQWRSSMKNCTCLCLTAMSLSCPALYLCSNVNQNISVCISAGS